MTDNPLARFNKVVEVPSYTDMEYSQHLNTPEWGREETDHLMDLANRSGNWLPIAIALAHLLLLLLLLLPLLLLLLLLLIPLLPLLLPLP